MSVGEHASEIAPGIELHVVDQDEEQADKTKKKTKWGNVKVKVSASSYLKNEQASENACCDICCGCCSFRCASGKDLDQDAIFEESDVWLVEEHIEEKGAYTSCVVFNFPDDRDDNYEQQCQLVGKVQPNTIADLQTDRCTVTGLRRILWQAVSRLIQAVAPDGQGEVPGQDRGAARGGGATDREGEP